MRSLDCVSVLSIKNEHYDKFSKNSGVMKRVLYQYIRTQGGST